MYINTYIGILKHWWELQAHGENFLKELKMAAKRCINKIRMLCPGFLRYTFTPRVY